MFHKNEAGLLRIFNSIFFVIMVAANIIFEMWPLNNVTTAEISARHDTALTPAGFTFAIWGIIYLWLFLFVLFQFGAFHKKTEGDNPDLIYALNALFIISSAANVAWLVAWHFDYIEYSFVLLFVMWVALLIAYIRLSREKMNSKEMFFVKMPFAIYLAWVSFAMVINFAAFFKAFSSGLLGISSEVWMITAIVLLTLYTEYFLVVKKDYLFALTALWAFAGILVRNITAIQDTIIPSNAFLVLIIAMGVLLMSLFLTGWMHRYKS